MIAKVRWFNPTFGYGFLRDTEGRDIFIHWSSFKQVGERAKLPSLYRKLTPKFNLSKNQLIQFKLVTGNGKLKAIECSKYVPNT